MSATRRESAELIEWEIRRGFRTAPQGYYPIGATKADPPLIMPLSKLRELLGTHEKTHKEVHRMKGHNYKIGNRPLCEKCGSDHLHSKGVVIREGGTMREWMCQKCLKRFMVPEVV